MVHGSRALERAGFRTIAYDARGHGESDPAPAGTGYGLRRARRRPRRGARRSRSSGRPYVLAGHSMGAHTLTALRARQPGAGGGARSSIGPVYLGAAADDESLDYWDALADGLERGGVDGFLAAYDHDLEPRWRDTILRITRDRLGRHRHPEAVAEALREVPRSRPFEDLSELEFLDVPALVVASHDEADPGHPYAVAEAWAARLPQRDARQRGPGRVAARLAGRAPVARDRRLLRAARGRRAARGLTASAPRPIAQPVDQPQARPGLVDRADLVVDQAERQARARGRRPRSGRWRRPRPASARRSRARRPGRSPGERLQAGVELRRVDEEGDQDVERRRPRGP